MSLFTPPRCFGYKESDMDNTPRDIFHMSKNCISCNFYSACLAESEKKIEKPFI